MPLEGSLVFKRKHRRKVEEPLVPIDGARVRAAIEWAGLSINGTASRIKVSQQTLDSIVRGKTKRCYQRLRDKLAVLLELPAQWLGGETDLAPSLAPWLPYPGLETRPPRVLDENLMPHLVPPEGDVALRSTLPPRYQLAAHRLCKQILGAWKRDIEGGNKEAQAALARFAVGQWRNREWDRASMLITRLVSAFWWRRLFLKPPPLPKAIDPSRNYTDEEWFALGDTMMRENQEQIAEQVEAADQIAANAAAALTTALRPWFENKRELSYPRFIETLEWASRGVGVTPKHIEEDAK